MSYESCRLYWKNKFFFCLRDIYNEKGERARALWQEKPRFLPSTVHREQIY